MKVGIILKNETFDDMFLIENIKKDLIKYLDEIGMTKKEIDDFISFYDEQYENHKIPYPTVEELKKLKN